MPQLTIAYINLTPNFGNKFSYLTHKPLVENLRKHFSGWSGFVSRRPEYSLGFIIATNRGVEELEVKGPTISRKLKVFDFSIFLPERIEKLNPEKSDDVGVYLDLVFSGIGLAMSKYKVSETEIEKIKEDCRKQLKII